MMITQQEYMVLKQPVRRLSIKIDLINENDAIVGSFEGIAIGGQITMDANSNYRRTGNLEMILDKKYNLLPSPTSKIWFNKRIGIYIGLKNFMDETVWFNMGRFAISNVNLDFSTSEKRLSCELLDYMAFLDGSLAGQLTHETRVVAQGVTINDAIKATLSGLAKISLDNVIVDGSLAVVPMDIEMPSGSTVYDLIKQLSDLYKNYTFYFNEEGYFRLEQIKNRKNDPIVWDFTDIDLSVNYSRSLNFQNVKNSIWVWGKQLDNGLQIVWNYRNRYARNTISEMNDINDMVRNDICHVISEGLSYVWDNVSWELLDFEVVPDFRMESIGEKVLSISDTNIYDDAQSKLRCEYELKNYSSWAESINISCVPIYSLDINNKIKLKIDEIGVGGDYLVKNITIPLSLETSSIQCEKIYY